MRSTGHGKQPDYLPIFLAGLLSGVIITICMLVWLRVSPGQLRGIEMEYSDLVAIILTAIGVILAVLAVFIGVLAVWGYSQFERMTSAASAAHIEKMLKDGPFSKKIDDTIINHVGDQLKEGYLRNLLIERIDELLLRDAQIREDSKVEEPEKGEPFTD